jgi:hypothetical protein
MRTYIAGSQAAAYDMGLNITYAVLSGLGFLGLLQSAYTLVVNRSVVSPRSSNPSNILPLRSVLQGSHAASNPLTRLMQREKLVNLILTVALVLSIVSSTKSFDPASFSLAQTLRVASVTIFLVVTALTTFLAAQLVLMERSTQHMLAMLIILLLLVREVFSEASAQSSGIGKNEALWYVLDSVSEVVAVALFAAPGLVPAKEKLQVAEEGQRKGSYVGL